MGWMDGFPFKSRAQLEKEQKEFEKRVLPLGAEQKEAALGVMRALMPQRMREDEMLFAFISAKDAYTKEEDEETGRAAVRHQLERNIRMKEPGKSYILALILLDTQVVSLEEYPTPAEVLALANTGAGPGTSYGDEDE